ncbi:MAG: dienelactone hydrolase family protein [Pseudomonadales bacterium]|nr:dienelactone hydrolase family protein [Pseudomonadales bacterium]
MCHIDALEAFAPATSVARSFGEVHALVFGDADADRHIAVLPDIYGTTPFYQGFCGHIASRGACVYLVDFFKDLGELPEVTREAAFARRHKLSDRLLCDQIQAFLQAQSIAALTGFCLGGNFVFEMAHRGYRGICHAIYPFPQGLANADGIAPGFDYLATLEHPLSIQIGSEDIRVGADNIAALQKIVAANQALSMEVFAGSGHGFFEDLDSDNPQLAANARRALALTEMALFA